MRTICFSRLHQNNYDDGTFAAEVLSGVPVQTGVVMTRDSSHLSVVRPELAWNQTAGGAENEESDIQKYFKDCIEINRLIADIAAILSGRTDSVHILIIGYI